MALEALLQLTRPGTSNGYEHVVEAVVACLDGDSSELQQAVWVLAHWQRSWEAWERLAKVMLKEDDDVRHAAYQAMLSMMSSLEHSSDKIFDAMQPFLETPDHDSCRLVIDIICAAVRRLNLSSMAAVSAARLALCVLGASSGTAQLTAMRTLIALAKFKEHLSSKEIACAVRPCVKADDCELRALACQALFNFTQNGDADISAEISVAMRTCKFEDGVGHIEQALSQFSDVDSATVPILITAFTALLRQRSEDSCKLVALRGLKAVSSKRSMLQSGTAADSLHNCSARKAALDHIQDPNPEVACAAITVLEQLCSQGDADVVPILAALAMNTEHREVLLALASLSQMGDETALQALRLRTKNGHWPMRHAALQAVARVATPGCQQTRELLQDSILNDNHPVVRTAAVEALASLTQPGDEQAIKFLEDEREEQPFEVQMAIDDALESIAWLAVQA
mmetsp:Transcript_51130/g.91857  ORF Transcript_51130/g.91857 Transcript_51130/m.91857 type:complete len:455 (-) Transcript_51130:86-1450(-)